MNIQVLVDGKLIYNKDADDYYSHEYHELVNDLSRELGVHLGEFNLSPDQIVMGVQMLKRGWTVERLRSEMWRR